jgi:hypothetical protein
MIGVMCPSHQTRKHEHHITTAPLMKLRDRSRRRCLFAPLLKFIVVAPLRRFGCPNEPGLLVALGCIATEC